MYVSPINQFDNIDEVKEFITTNGFAILVNQVDAKPWATHIPLVLEKSKEGKDILVGHIAKANPQWKSFLENDTVLAIFNGPHSYISSSWYDHENVPTWNYIAVHLYGKLTLIEGDALYQSLVNLVDKYEKSVENPVSVEKMSQKMILKEMRGIVGFYIEITEIHAVKKLSQNRDDHNYKNIIEELNKTEDENAKNIASEMKCMRNL